MKIIFTVIEFLFFTFSFSQCKRVLRLPAPDIIRYTVVIITLIIVAACNKVTEPVCEFVPQSFSTDINPIIQNSCAVGSGCHGGGSINGPGPLLTFDQIKNSAAAIKTAVENKQMPLNGSLTPEQIQSISCWVNNGARNN